MDGDNRLTVAEILRIPKAGPTAVRNLLVGIDEFPGEYIEAFDEPPEPADVANMRLTKRGAKPNADRGRDHRRAGSDTPPDRIAHTLGATRNVDLADPNEALQRTTPIRDCAK